MPQHKGKDFNVRLGWLRFSKNGNLTSKPIDKEMYDAIQQVEPGGKYFIKTMVDKDGEEFAVLEFMSKAKVDEFQATLPPKAQEEESL